MESNVQLRNAILTLSIAALCPVVAPCLNTHEMMPLLKSDGTGSDVVKAVISKLHSLQILECDHHFLRRIALVETNDGTTGVPHGGIWALGEDKFNVVANEAVNVLSSKLCLNTAYGITYAFLKKPLVSGLTAGLYLNYLENSSNARLSIPLAGNIEEQAQFWITYYHSREFTASYFMEQVEGREGRFRSKCDIFATEFTTAVVFL